MLVLYTVAYILPFGWFWCCGKLLGGLWVWLGLPSFWCCLLDASFVTRDRFFIDFYLKVVLVIYPFCFSISALLFLSQCLVGLVFYTCYKDWEFWMTFIAFFILLYWKIRGSCIFLHMDLRRYLHWITWMRVVFRLSYRKGRHLEMNEYFCISCSGIPYFSFDKDCS